MRLLLLLALAGCATLDQQATGYSSNVLCYGQYAGNRSQIDAATRELDRRGFSCERQNIDAGMAEWNAIQDRRAGANAAIGAYFLNRAAPPPPTPSTTQTYILNGRSVTCTTTGSVTNCY